MATEEKVLGKWMTFILNTGEQLENGTMERIECFVFPRITTSPELSRLEDHPDINRKARVACSMSKTQEL